MKDRLWGLLWLALYIVILFGGLTLAIWLLGVTDAR